MAVGSRLESCPVVSNGIAGQGTGCSPASHGTGARSESACRWQSCPDERYNLNTRLPKHGSRPRASKYCCITYHITHADHSPERHFATHKMRSAFIYSIHSEKMSIIQTPIQLLFHYAIYSLLPPPSSSAPAPEMHSLPVSLTLVWNTTMLPTFHISV
jgi:hypothetical protein